MESLWDNLAGIMNAAKDNQLGLMALAVLVISIVAVLLFRRSPIWARLVAVLLVFMACSVPAIIVFEKLGGVAPGQNGSVCRDSTDCASSYCYPGPHPKPGGSGLKFCVAAELHCALPGLDGAQYGNVVVKDSTRLTCKDPGNNRAAQFLQ